MNLVERAKNILITPKTEWEVIKGENLTINQMFMQYAVILAAIPAIADFIGKCFVGVTIPLIGVTYRIPIGTGIAYMISMYVLSLAGIYVVALIMDALAPSFGSTKNMVASMKVTVFSYTAAWVAGIFNILPFLGILSILGLYSLALLYMGMKTVKEVPPDKMVGYFLILIIAVIIVYFVIGAIVGGIFLSGYMLDYVR